MIPSTPTVARAGGALLALGALTYAVTIVAYVVLYGQPTGTGTDGWVTMANRVAHYVSKQQLATALWLLEFTATVLLAVAGFVLHHRRRQPGKRFAPAVAWTVVGVGSIMLSLMYAVMIGGYPSAAAVFATEPGLFSALNGIAVFVFNAGNAVVFAGLACAFVAETSAARAFPRRLGTAGSVLSVISTVVALGMLIGIDALQVAAPLGLLVFVITAYFGFTISRSGDDASEPIVPPESLPPVR